MSLLHSSNRPRDNRFENGTSLVVKEMDLVDDDEGDEVRVGSIGRFASDDIPFLRSSDDDLSSSDLLLRELSISGKFVNDDAIRFESFREVTDHLLDERLHGSDVNNLERGEIEFSSLLVAVLGELVENCQHGNVRLYEEKKVSHAVLETTRKMLTHLSSTSRSTK